MNPSQSKTRVILTGILVSNFVSLVLVGANKFLWVKLDSAGDDVLILSSFVLVPILVGIISAYFWRNLHLKTWGYIGWSTLNTFIAIILSFLFLEEGAFCLIIVSPLILVFTVTGAFVGRVMFRQRNKTLKSTVFGILLLAFIADTLSEHEHVRMVSDTMIVNAPIEKVWPLVVEYEPITAKENYWFFKIGLPSPVQSTVDGHHAGAGRKCIFSNGYVFDEKMIVYKPNEELTFDITHQPRDPEIMGHIDILRGQFLLKDNGDGTTTLIGNSWYKLYIFPGWYFDLWSESITRNVHLRVMEHIKMISENDV
ncbi:MAG TPA: hypothetical protein VFU05_10645 [Cyclobacteriaceae bacterium]|nr:hypothetical protein [Cyclobacteriaceae bacterium]